MAKQNKIDLKQLEALMRLKPTQADTAAFFGVSEDTIDRLIKKNWKITFAEFRDQRMVHTRFSLIRKALHRADNGSDVMLIFCLKNLCGWKDKEDLVTQGNSEITLNYNFKDE